MVTVTQTVSVELDDSKFTEEFMQEFRESFYPFYELSDHAEHIGQLAAREMFSAYDDFIEGYGPAKEMGIKAMVTDTDIEASKQ